MDCSEPLDAYLAYLRAWRVEFGVSDSLRHEPNVHSSSLENQSSPRTLEISPSLHVLEHHTDGLGATHATMTLARSLCNDVQFSPDMRAIELGSGTGVLSITAALLGATITSVELNQDANELARHNFQEAGLVPAILNANILDSTHAMSDAPYDLVIANLPQKPTDPDCKLRLANDGGIDGISLYDAALPFLRTSLSLAGQFLFFQHSLPSPSWLVSLQRDFRLTLCAWRQRFIRDGEFDDLLPFWAKRHKEKTSFLQSSSDGDSLVFCAWHAERNSTDI
jgi:predicted O-methyltransferase YrrM